MAVQITPYQGFTPLKGIAFGDKMRQGQQRLTQDQRRLDMQELQNQRVYEQNQTRNRLTQQQIGQAAANAKMTDQQFMVQLTQEIIAGTPNAEEAIKYMSAISPPDRPMAEEAKTFIRGLSPELFGTALRQNKPANLIEREGLLGDLSSDDPQVSESAAVALGLQARPVTGGPQIFDVGGVPHIYDPRTGEGGSLKIDGNIVSLEEVLGNKIATASAGPLANQAVETSKEALESLKTVQSNISNYGEAIRLLDEGASTGRISNLLPSVKNATLELENVQQRLGLNVIEQVTFGALSEGELELALKTALPTGLDEAGLRDWLSRKMDAQQKLAVELQRAAIYLGTPGNTVGAYLKLMKEVGKSYAVDSSATGEKPQPSGKDISREELEDEARRRGLI